MSVEKAIQTANPPKPLLSSHSIRILSGILVGVGVTEVVPEAFRVSACLGGVVGLIAYFTLQSVARRNEKRDEALQRLQDATKLEGLVDRHISRLAYRPRRHHFSPSRPAMERQYVTVAASNRSRLRSSH